MLFMSRKALNIICSGFFGRLYHHLILTLIRDLYQIKNEVLFKHVASLGACRHYVRPIWQTHTKALLVLAEEVC